MDRPVKLADSLLLIEGLQRCKSSKEVGDAFAEMIAPHGFTIVSCGGGRETPSGPVWEFFFNTWPAEWPIECRIKDYVRHAIVPAMARLSMAPFALRELRQACPTAGQVEFDERIRDFGVVDGFAVPIHHPGGDVGLCVSFATHAIENTEERLALHMASFYAHDRCRALGGLIEQGSLKIPLSPRELECLKWVLGGKSDTDIAAILGISHNTVHFHVERMKKKLGVRTRTQAAAVVASLGYL